MTKHGIVGYGQIGQAVGTIIGPHIAFELDLSTDINHKVDVMHVCFPYTDNFIQEVKRYQSHLEPNLTIIHSTVPVGTTEQIRNAVHSPVRGKHPDLAPSLQTFIKFFGGERAEEAADYFTVKGVPAVCTPKSATTEALKLFDTEQYRINILIEKAIHKYCKDHNLDFDVVYTQANKSYNTGYADLGMPQFTKYVLEHKDEPIGGHCVIPNSKLLNLLDLIHGTQTNL